MDSEVNEENPTVSVIIPSYNCERYISETIDSILGQTFRDLELIVVDDGSTDRTREIVSSYGPPVRLVTQQNARVCAARNRGIRESRGKYICLMDHDDYWFAHKLASQVKCLEEHPDAGAAHSPFILWHPDANGIFPPPEGMAPQGDLEEISAEDSGWMYHRLLFDCVMLTSSAMFRREVFEKCGNFDESLPYSEDWDLWFRISRVYPFVKLRQPTTLYRQHPLQGNRVVRDIDYRTVLLEKAFNQWGLTGPDGQSADRKKFMRQLAKYHADFGLHHLQAGHVKKASESFVKAWKRNPIQPKYLAYIAAGLLGWRPKW